MRNIMKAIVVYRPGGPEVLTLEERPVPKPTKGQILIEVRAFGLNRSELFTRRGQSPNVRFPRILGIEAVGTVAAAPGGEFAEGEAVATLMGGMGRDFDGSYAEYTLVPAAQVQAVTSDLPWETLGALPEMLQTAWGSLFRSLQLQRGDRLLVRGGTTSVGRTAIAIAKAHGAEVAATSRRSESEKELRQTGADHFVHDVGEIAADVRGHWQGGADKVLELVGTTTLLDSLQCVKEPGAVCMTGMVGNQWTLDGFNPMDAIPTGVRLTTYAGDVSDFVQMPFRDLVDQVAAGTVPIKIGRVFPMCEIREAHMAMEENHAGGKIVILTHPR